MKRTGQVAGRRGTSAERRAASRVRGTALGRPPWIGLLRDRLRERLPPWLSLWLLAVLILAVLLTLGGGLALAPRATISVALALAGLAFLALDVYARRAAGRTASRRKGKSRRP